MIVTRNTVQKHIPGKAKARAEWAATTLASDRFYFARVKLLKVANPIETESLVANVSTSAPLVIDANTRGYGKTDVYTPKALVASGGALRKKLLNAGTVFAMAWVGEKALEAAGVGVLDGITSDELQQKVTCALRDKFVKNVTDPYSFDGPYIQQLYPFDNYVIYNLAGQSYRMTYNIDTTERTVTLTGSPEKVEQEYVVQSASETAVTPLSRGDYAAFDNRSKAPYAPTGVRVDPTLILPSLFTVSLGASNSELRNPAFGPGFLNVDEVVAAYLSQVKNGYHKPVLPPNAPIVGVRMLFAKEVHARGVVSPADLMQWVNSDAGKAAIKAAGAGADPVIQKKALLALNKMHQHIQKAQAAAKTGNTLGFVKHEKVAQHAGKAYNAFKSGDMDAGKKHLGKAKAFAMGTKSVKLSDVNTALQAGGPGSGPRPDGGSGVADQDAHDDGNHNHDANEGQTDAYGYTHNADAREATAKAAQKAGLQETTPDFLKSRSMQVFSNGKHSVNVQPDGSWSHAKAGAPYFHNYGSGASDLSRESFK